MIASGTLTCQRCGTETAWPARCNCPPKAADALESSGTARRKTAKEIADSVAKFPGLGEDVFVHASDYFQAENSRIAATQDYAELHKKYRALLESSGELPEAIRRAGTFNANAAIKYHTDVMLVREPDYDALRSAYDTLRTAYQGLAARLAERDEQLSRAVDVEMEKVMALSSEQLQAICRMRGHDPDDEAKIVKQIGEICILKHRLEQAEARGAKWLADWQQAESMVAGLTARVAEISSENHRLHTRLEDNFAFVNGERVEMSVPFDGIACRDVTIKGQDETIDAQKARIAELERGYWEQKR